MYTVIARQLDIRYVTTSQHIYIATVVTFNRILTYHITGKT